MNKNDKNDIRRKIKEMKKENKNGNRQDSPRMNSPFVFMIIILLAFSFIFSGRVKEYFEVKEEISYSQFLNKINNKEFKEVIEKDTELISKVKKDKGEITYITRKATERIGNDQQIMDAINKNNVSLVVSKPSGSTMFLYFLINSLPIIIMLVFGVILLRKMSGEGGSGGPGGMFGFGKSRADKLSKRPDVKFEDVAGIDGVKEELKEIVDFLKDPEKFTKAGARVPKGVLLLGRPGTGKTLLAKAVAGESGASFFSLSGSEFVEMFVGVGASRVRDLFDKAKKAAPSIVFIDEIDAIGRKRSTGRNGGNDEREQTLNQLLVEMDGFETDTKVIVIAATNREDILDSALLRAGRFDRRITVDAPDLKGRIDILKVHARGKKLSDDVNLENIARVTPGFVGADLENLLNEAAILAARKNSDTISMEELDEAVDKIGMGLGKKGKIIKPEEKKLLAYHEAGHAVMTEITEGADPVHKVTIIPRGGAGGYMMPLLEEKLIPTRKELLAEIKVLFAGRAAEEIALDDISTGASNDIERATRIAKLFVERVGMSHLGPIDYSNHEEVSFLPSKSNETSREIDLEVRKLLKECYDETVRTLKENREILDKVANLLLKKETITGDEVREIILGKPSDEESNIEEL